MESKLPSSTPNEDAVGAHSDATAGQASDPRATRVIAGSASADTDNGGQPAKHQGDPPPSQSAQKTLSKLGDFLLLKKIGSGAMGAVYRARHIPTDEQFALKVLFRHVAANPKLLERFHREAEVSRSFEHPNIIRGYGSGKDHKWHFFAMEYVDGHSLQKWLNRLGKLNLGDSLHILRRCALALEYAHNKGVVHRDIKPDNILITAQGEVKVADLGMVKRLDEDMSLTQTGHAVGTPWYMPLEQARNAKETDGRCDIYALGCVFYACLTGQPPFTGPTLVDVIQAKEAGTFPRARKFNSEIPERIDLIVAKMAAKYPKDRYQSVAELLRDLESVGLANPTLRFLEAVEPGSTAVKEVADDDSDSKTSSTSADNNTWYIRYRRASGVPVVQKMTFEQVMRLLEQPSFDPAVKASRSPSEGFRALATFREFEKAALGRVSRTNADQQTKRQRRLYEKIVAQQEEQEKDTRAQTSTFRYWMGYGVRIGLIAGGAILLLVAVYFAVRSII